MPADITSYKLSDAYRYYKTDVFVYIMTRWHHLHPGITLIYHHPTTDNICNSSFLFASFAYLFIQCAASQTCFSCWLSPNQISLRIVTSSSLFLWYLSQKTIGLTAIAMTNLCESTLWLQFTLNEALVMLFNYIWHFCSFH